MKLSRPSRAPVAALTVAALTVAALTFGAAPVAAKTHYTKAVRLARACPLFENYPKAGVPPRAWTKTTRSGRVGLRYNVNSHYVLVLDYARAEAKINPHWGFLDRGCLRAQLDKPSLVGVGGNGRDRAVDFRPRPVHTIGARGALGPATLRSGPKSFVTGNLEAGDHFRITGRCSGRSSTSFVFGYARVAKRWGWVQSVHLRGDPCAPRAARLVLRNLHVGVRQVGRYDIDQLNGLTVCGPRGRLLLRFSERKHFPSSGQTARRTHVFRRSLTRRCERYTFRWRVAQDLAGIGSYTMTYRGQIGRVQSRTGVYRGTTAD